MTLGRAELIEHIPYPKQEKKLPVVLSRDELARFFGAIANLKHRTILMTMYATGLRLSEALGLRSWMPIGTNAAINWIRVGTPGRGCSYFSRLRYDLCR